MNTEEPSEVRDLKPSETVILLAEDDTLVRNLVRLMLSKEGYAVLTANDGLEALVICERFTDPIHLLLTDVGMPRMSGLDLAERVRKLRPDTKIIIMSATTAMQKRRRQMHFFGSPSSRRLSV